MATRPRDDAVARAEEVDEQECHALYYDDQAAGGDVEPVAEVDADYRAQR